MEQAHRKRIGKTGDHASRRRRRRPARTGLKALAGAVVMALSTAACGSETATAVFLELLMTGQVTLDGEVYSLASVQFQPVAGGAPIETQTDADGRYQVTLDPDVLYLITAFDVGGGLCPAEEIQSPAGELSFDVGCRSPAGDWQLSYTYESDTCGFGSVDDFSSEYAWQSPTPAEVSLVHDEGAPPLEGTWNDRERLLWAATDWTDLGNGNEVMEDIQVNLNFPVGGDPMLDGISITTFRQISSGATCTVNMLLVLDLLSAAAST